MQGPEQEYGETGIPLPAALGATSSTGKSTFANVGSNVLEGSIPRRESLLKKKTDNDQN